MLSEGDIQRIAHRVAGTCSPLVVGTFGSYAVGRAREGSDLDLFVIQAASGLRRKERRRVAMRPLLAVMNPLDVHVFTPEEFELEALETLSFAWVIARQARIYLWTDDARERLPSLVSHATWIGVKS